MGENLQGKPRHAWGVTGMQPWSVPSPDSSSAKFPLNLSQLGEGSRPRLGGQLLPAKVETRSRQRRDHSRPPCQPARLLCRKPQPGPCQQQTAVSPASGGQASGIEMPADLSPGEDSAPGSWTATVSLGHLPLRRRGGRAPVSPPLLVRTQISAWGPHPQGLS